MQDIILVVVIAILGVLLIFQNYKFNKNKKNIEKTIYKKLNIFKNLFEFNSFSLI